MNVCIIGLGSIGQRHLKNIHAVAKTRGIEVATDVVEPRALDYLDAATRALVRERFATPAEVGRYDMIFVANPSQLHRETLEAAKDKAKFFFVEKPVFTEALAADARQMAERRLDRYRAGRRLPDERSGVVHVLRRPSLPMDGGARTVRQRLLRKELVC